MPNCEEAFKRAKLSIPEKEKEKPVKKTKKKSTSKKKAFVKREVKPPKMPPHKIAQLFNPIDKKKLENKKLVLNPNKGTKSTKHNIDGKCPTQTQTEVTANVATDNCKSKVEVKIENKTKQNSGSEAKGNMIKPPKSKEVSNYTLCHYDGLPFTQHDYDTLAKGEWLNDVAVHFGVNRAFKENSDTEGFIYFSSDFFLNLATDQKDNPEMMKLPLRERRYQRVKNWFKKTDIFSKEAAIFIVCDNTHWVTLLAVDLDIPVPILAVLDSKPTCPLGDIASKMVAAYLEDERMTKHGEEISVHIVKPKYVPRQAGGNECGLFTIQFVSSLLRCGPEDCQLLLNHGKLGSSLRVVTDSQQYRVKLALLVRALAVEQGSSVMFPKLDFPEVGQFGGVII